jgi:hypothetical protein
MKKIDSSAPALRAEIRTLLDQALQKYGPTMEIGAIENSWGVDLDDAQALKIVRRYLETGMLFEHQQVSDDVEQFREEYRNRRLN